MGDQQEMTRRAMVLSLAGTLGVPGLARAQDDGPPLPAYQRGDTWQFERQASFGPSGSYRHTVGEVYETELLVMQQMGSGTRNAQFTREFNPIYIVKGERFVREWLRFPLKAGLEWDNHYQTPTPTRDQSTRRVAGPGRVSTPAGEFDAIRITCEGLWQNFTIVGGNNQGDFTEDYWYAPAAKRIVKYDAVYKQKLGVGRQEVADEHWQLVSYKLA